MTFSKLLDLSILIKVAIINIINIINIIKVHGHDDISIRMNFDKAILELQSIIFKNCINTGIFLDLWTNITLLQCTKKEANSF